MAFDASIHLRANALNLQSSNVYFCFSPDLTIVGEFIQEIRKTSFKSSSNLIDPSYDRKSILPVNEKRYKEYLSKLRISSTDLISRSDYFNNIFYTFIQSLLASQIVGVNTAGCSLHTMKLMCEAAFRVFDTEKDKLVILFAGNDSAKQYSDLTIKSISSKECEGFYAWLEQFGEAVRPHG